MVCTNCAIQDSGNHVTNSSDKHDEDGIRGAEADDQN